MIKKFKSVLKNSKGFTLVELLAVIVILGIIAAIAVPSIAGIIENSKKDAMVADAQQMIAGAKLAVTGDTSLQPASNAINISYGYLIEKGYVEPIKDPFGDGNIATTGGSYATAGTPGTDNSYVTVTKSGLNFTYSVQLVGSSKKIESVSESVLNKSKRENVK